MPEVDGKARIEKQEPTIGALNMQWIFDEGKSGSCTSGFVDLYARLPRTRIRGSPSRGVLSVLSNGLKM